MTFNYIYSFNKYIFIAYLAMTVFWEINGGRKNTISAISLQAFRDTDEKGNY